ncbi:MAG: hypothetical protein UZ18_ATM001000263 [Armatimonadetes bacterium OLB18]|nr:MAG: hypothetical protein UZ18_ATM001000263 [Armatimonadetes bacterium OLB18]
MVGVGGSAGPTGREVRAKGDAWWDLAPKMKAVCKVATLNFANLWPGPTPSAATKQTQFPLTSSTTNQVWGGTQIGSYEAPPAVRLGNLRNQSWAAVGTIFEGSRFGEWIRAARSWAPRYESCIVSDRCGGGSKWTRQSDWCRPICGSTAFSP